MSSKESISMDRYLHPVMDFMRKPSCDYALLLNGKWGSGKTFFVTHELKEELEKNGYRLIHTSLFGKITINQVNNESLWKLVSDSQLPEKILDEFSKQSEDSKASTLAAINVIGRTAANVLLKRKFEKETERNKILFVFDDLERCKTESLKDILGEIHSQYIENGCHVLFVADESKLMENANVWYSQGKEKIIRHTLNFSYPELFCLVASIVSRRNNSPINRLYNADTEAFDKFVSTVNSVVNIRTWLASFDYYDTIVDKCSFSPDYPYFLQLYCIVFLTTHYIKTRNELFRNDSPGENNTTNKEKKAPNLFKTVSDDFGIPPCNLLDYSPAFKLRFSGTTGNLKFARIDSIISYIEDGFCNADEIKKEMESHFSVSSEAAKCLNRAYDYNILSENELKGCLIELFKYVRCGDYNLEQLIQLGEFIEALDNMGYLKLYGDEFSCYQKTLTDAVDNISKEKTGDFFRYGEFSNKYDEYMKRNPSFLKDAVERVRLKYFDYETYLKNLFIDTFTHLDEHSPKDISYDSENGKGTIQRAWEYNLFPVILDYTSKAIDTLRLYLEYLTLASDSGDMFGSEIPYLEKLDNFLSDNLSKMKICKEKIDLTGLKNTITGTIQKLRRTSHEETTTGQASQSGMKEK